MVPVRKDKKRYLKGKEGKVKEIKKSLTERARLRKSYFKLLEKEGLEVPDKKDYNEKEIESDDNFGTEEETKREKRKPLNFQERMLLKKERKQKERQERLQRTKEKVDIMKKKEAERARKAQLIKNAKTNRGQPLMGPRINNLLEKIKQGKN